MSTPWCQLTSARPAPHESLNEACASTGNTYGAPSSCGVPLSSGAAVPLSPPTDGAFGAGANRGGDRRVVAVDTGGCGAGRGAVVAAGGGAVVAVGAVVVSSGSVSTVVVVSVVVVSAVVVHSGGTSAVVVVTATVLSSQGGGTPAGAGAASEPAAAATADAASTAATDLAAGPIRGGSKGGNDTKCGPTVASAAVGRGRRRAAVGGPSSCVARRGRYAARYEQTPRSQSAPSCAVSTIVSNVARSMTVLPASSATIRLPSGRL